MIGSKIRTAEARVVEVEAEAGGGRQVQMTSSHKAVEVRLHVMALGARQKIALSGEGAAGQGVA